MAKLSRDNVALGNTVSESRILGGVCSEVRDLILQATNRCQRRHKFVTNCHEMLYAACINSCNDALDHKFSPNYKAAKEKGFKNIIVSEFAVAGG